MQVYCEMFCTKLTIHSRHRDHLSLRKVQIFENTVAAYTIIKQNRCPKNQWGFYKNVNVITFVSRNEQARNRRSKSHRVMRVMVNQLRLIWRLLCGTVTAAPITIVSENDIVRYRTPPMSGTRTATSPISASKFRWDLLRNARFSLMKNGPL